MSNTMSKEIQTIEIAPWHFYIIYHISSGATYAGVSPDPIKRLRMHNGEIKGGAKYTLSKGPGWVHICLIKGFPTKQNAMQFEWAIKHIPPRNVGGLESRLKKLGILLRKTQWTSKSPLAITIPLEIEWKDCIDEKIYDVNKCVVGSLPSYITEYINSQKDC